MKYLYNPYIRNPLKPEGADIENYVVATGQSVSLLAGESKGFTDNIADFLMGQFGFLRQVDETFATPKIENVKVDVPKTEPNPTKENFAQFENASFNDQVSAVDDTSPELDAKLAQIEGKHVCPDCGKIFTRAVALSGHTTSHK